jgi:hypothetical protein
MRRSVGMLGIEFDAMSGRSGELCTGAYVDDGLGFVMSAREDSSLLSMCS